MYKKKNTYVVCVEGQVETNTARIYPVFISIIVLYIMTSIIQRIRRVKIIIIIIISSGWPIIFLCTLHNKYRRLNEELDGQRVYINTTTRVFTTEAAQHTYNELLLLLLAFQARHMICKSQVLDADYIRIILYTSREMLLRWTVSNKNVLINNI